MRLYDNVHHKKDKILGRSHVTRLKSGSLLKAAEHFCAKCDFL
jgi:hypothetical protein